MGEIIVSSTFRKTANSLVKGAVIFGIGLGAGVKFSDKISALPKTNFAQAISTTVDRVTGAIEDMTSTVKSAFNSGVSSVPFTGNDRKSDPQQLTLKQRAALIEIRKDFNELSSDSDIPDNTWDVVKIHLKEYGLNYEDLDPTATKTRAEMEAEGNKRLEIASLRAARREFMELKNPSEFAFIPYIQENIAKYLKLAKRGYEALDESGQRSAAQVQAEIESLAKAAEVREARDVYAKLATSTIPGTDIDVIDANLKYANAGYAALDPTGNSSDDQIRAEIKRRVETAIKSTQHLVQ
jgi:hypothetical protein